MSNRPTQSQYDAWCEMEHDDLMQELIRIETARKRAEEERDALLKTPPGYRSDRIQPGCGACGHATTFWHCTHMVPHGDSSPAKGVSEDMSDAELLDYIEEHSKTELGQTHRTHVVRLLELAGEDASRLGDQERHFLDYSTVKPLVDKARANA